MSRRSQYLSPRKYSALNHNNEVYIFLASDLSANLLLF